MKPSVRIVIVNYRTPGLVVDCLRSLAPQVRELADARVVVVDGGSGDGSTETLVADIRQEGWGRWVELLPLADNRGFAAGNNAAIRPWLHSPAAPDYVLLLNPDTVVRPGGVRALVEFMEAHPGAGIAGSRLEDPDGTPQRSAFRFPSLASEFDGGLRLGLVTNLLSRYVVAPTVRDESHEADWVSGASLMVRRAVFEAVGLMDEAFFLYYEETELCFRARRAGWTTWYVPESRVVHLVGQSTGLNSNQTPARRIPEYWLRSRRHYFSKCHGALYRVACDVAWAVGFLCWRVRRRVQGKPDRDPPNLLVDFLRFSLDLPRKSQPSRAALGSVPT